MYERMRAAVSHLRNDVQKLENEVPRPSTEHILQGTKVRDVILRSFKIGHKRAAPAEEEVSTTNASAGTESGGIFKQDQRIQSWAKRYSQHNPMVMEGDPPLVGLNASQIRAMATMIGERMSLIQGVGPIFVLEVRCQNELTSMILASGHRKNKNHHRNYKTPQSQLKCIHGFRRLIFSFSQVHFEVPQPILVCTYTNVAVDNLVEGFAKVGVKPLRVGYNGNVRESLLQHSLDYKLQQHPLHRPLTAFVEEQSTITPKTQKLLQDCQGLDEKIKASVRPRKSSFQRVSNMKAAIVKLEERQVFLKRRIYAMQQDMLKDVIEAADVVRTVFSLCLKGADFLLNLSDLYDVHYLCVPCTQRRRFSCCVY